MANLEMTRGDARDIEVVVTTVSGTTTSAADLTGKRFFMTAKYNYSDTDAQAVFQKSSGTGIAVATASNGTATVTLHNTDTDDLPPVVTQLVWDVQMDGNPGSPITLGRGLLIVNPDVTLTT